MFKNRTEAGNQLAKKLTDYKGKNAIVLGIPRGGIPVGYSIAKELDLPLDCVLTRKIGHPGNKEYAIGGVGLHDYFIIPHKDVSDEYIAGEISQIRKRLQQMHEKFVGNRTPVNLSNKIIILVDDGVATGNTIHITIDILRKSNPKKIIVATPVAAKSSVRELSVYADEVIVLIVPDEFNSVGAFYEDFSQVEDEDVLYYLDKSYQLQRTVSHSA